MGNVIKNVGLSGLALGAVLRAASANAASIPQAHLRSPGADVAERVIMPPRVGGIQLGTGFSLQRPTGPAHHTLSRAFDANWNGVWQLNLTGAKAPLICSLEVAEIPLCSQMGKAMVAAVDCGADTNVGWGFPAYDDAVMFSLGFVDGEAQLALHDAGNSTLVGFLKSSVETLSAVAGRVSPDTQSRIRTKDLNFSFNASPYQNGHDWYVRTC